ncbi:MAG TPA: hypothetical protein HA263_03955 [Methanoregulaceae archaeon]|nr:hypothetical protein [Methanoregulaceae archaeon]
MERPSPFSLVPALLLLSALVCAATAAGVGTFSLEQTKSAEKSQIGVVTLYMDNTWQPQANDVWVTVNWDRGILGYISTDWRVGNSVSATPSGTNSLFLQMADLTNKYGNGKIAIADINFKALASGTSPLTVTIDHVISHPANTQVSVTDLTQSAVGIAGTFVVKETPTPVPPVPRRLGAIVASSTDSLQAEAVVDYDASRDQYGYYAVYRYPDNRGWYRHQSDSTRHTAPRTEIEGGYMLVVDTVDTTKVPPLEARYVYPPLKYTIGDIVGETATGPFRVVTRVSEGEANYFAPGSYMHKVVWKDSQGQWRSYDDHNSQEYGAQADFEGRYPVKATHVELGTVIGGSTTTPPVVKPPPVVITTTIPTPTTPATLASAPPAAQSPTVAQPTPIVIVVERTADIDPGMTRYSGLTAPPTASELRSTAAAASTPSTVSTVPVATTVAAAPLTTYAAAVASTAPPAENGSSALLAMGALLAAFALVVGVIAYRPRAGTPETPVTIMSRRHPGEPAPPLTGPVPVIAATALLPWDGYSPLASDSYDLLARLRRYEDGVRQTGLGGTIPLGERLDLSLIPTLPIPSVAKELGPGVGCQVLSVDHRGAAVCLRDPGSPSERLDVMPVEEILRLIEAQYEQRWVPREP